MRSILLVDHDKQNRLTLAAKLRKEIGALVLEAECPEEAIRAINGMDISLLVTDIFLPDKSGIELMKTVRQQCPGVVSVLGIPEGNRDTIVEALNAGALFYINAPYDLDEAVIVAARSLAHHDLVTHHEPTGPKIRKSEGFHGIIGKAPKMLKLFGFIKRVAEDGDSTVLIQGESGTGKELVAKAIHAYSPRSEKNFVPVNCAAIPDDLLESELFGYLKGAFTGATQNKKGRLQYAEGGTLFLDEIGDMKPALQAKLLRVLQEKEYEPVGAVKPIKVDVRIVAATHRNLEQAVKNGIFREDLYYRLSVVPIAIPPLRERKEDIPLLMETFRHVYSRGKKNSLTGFAPEAIATLLEYPWPGNVRELENLVQRLSILHGESLVTVDDLPEKYTAGRPVSSAPAPTAILSPELPKAEERTDFNSQVSEFEDRLILQALLKTGGNKKEAAELLNLKRTTLLEKIKKKKLDRVFEDELSDKLQ